MNYEDVTQFLSLDLIKYIMFAGISTPKTQRSQGECLGLIVN